MAALEDLRTKTSELLDEGARNGALTPEEYSWRKAHLAQAETVDALESLVEDLLGPLENSSMVMASPRISQMTIMANRTFTVPDLGRRSELVTLMGSSRVDLTDLAEGQELTLELVTILGDAVVEVPPGVKVRVDCTPVMGDCRIDPGVRDTSAPIRITGVVLMGSLRVVTKTVRGRPRS